MNEMCTVDMLITLLLIPLPIWWVFLVYHAYVAWLKDDPQFLKARPKWIFDQVDDSVCLLIGGVLISGVWSFVALMVVLIVNDLGFLGTLNFLKWVAIAAATVWAGRRAARIHKRLYKMREKLSEKCSFFKELMGK